MVERHAISTATAAVVTDHGEALEAEGLHRLDLIARHGALGIGLVIRCRRRLPAVAVAAQIGADDCVALGEFRRHLVPHGMRLRMSMQQKDGRSASAMTKIDDGAGGFDLAMREILEHAAVVSKT